MDHPQAERGLLFTALRVTALRHRLHHPRQHQGDRETGEGGEHRGRDGPAGHLPVLDQEPGERVARRYTGARERRAGPRFS